MRSLIELLQQGLLKGDEFTDIWTPMNAYWQKWKNLESREVWKWEDCIEWEDRSSVAIERGKEARFGFLFGTMVEKGSEFPEGEKIFRAQRHVQR